MNTVDKAEQLVKIYYKNATDFMDSESLQYQPNDNVAIVG